MLADCMMRMVMFINEDQFSQQSTDIEMGYGDGST